ncbi:hypothetical protein SAMN02745885_01140 [Carboxydocella sporoproducens DSM 16521]|uniref:Uncharacterized protein n=2 Tax=Carboxydocella TaxID=178898 RepID=A0A1T4P392_9FIRM|nr:MULTISPECIES: hypothetical protein [Carboxydocella]AVX19558.1 hypothetical protein CFE_0359 [Carboxydocella thermautotrophica]AVX29975.1 hypothetical protein CTH_0368 [Carboxydocella thermautotrophica]SJZ85983.1 hypothetical protein SAMN02745885_01140 [Carboxydocella sporoproducens DSM 16521]
MKKSQRLILFLLTIIIFNTLTPVYASDADIYRAALNAGKKARKDLKIGIKKGKENFIKGAITGIKSIDKQLKNGEISAGTVGVLYLKGLVSEEFAKKHMPQRQFKALKKATQQSDLITFFSPSNWVGDRPKNIPEALKLIFEKSTDIKDFIDTYRELKDDENPLKISEKELNKFLKK